MTLFRLALTTLNFALVAPFPDLITVISSVFSLPPHLFGRVRCQCGNWEPSAQADSRPSSRPRAPPAALPPKFPQQKKSTDYLFLSMLLICTMFRHECRFLFACFYFFHYGLELCGLLECCCKHDYPWDQSNPPHSDVLAWSAPCLPFQEWQVSRLVAPPGHWVDTRGRKGSSLAESRAANTATFFCPKAPASLCLHLTLLELHFFLIYYCGRLGKRNN